MRRAQRARAEKGIARGPQRGRTGLPPGGVLFVAEKPVRARLQKISELYDRVGFAAAGKFNEFDNLRARRDSVRRPPAVIAYDRRDVTRPAAGQRLRADAGHHLHRAGPSPTRSSCVWPKSPTTARPNRPELYRITYDGSINDEPHFRGDGRYDRADRHPR